MIKMLQKYLDAPLSSAPEWMKNLQKLKFVKYAEIFPTRFVFIIGGMLTQIARYEFTILFYSSFDGAGHSSFVAMDNKNGNQYLIKYWEDHTESSSYAIEYSELLDAQKFEKILESLKNKLPEIEDNCRYFYQKNWEEFLHTPQRQVVSAFYLAICFERNDQQYLLHFISGRSLPVCFSCRTEHYRIWREKHNYLLSDLIYLEELMGSEFLAAKKALGFSFKKLKKYNNCRDEIFKQANSAISNDGNIEIVFIKNGLLEYRKRTSNEILEDSVLEMFDILEYKK